MDKKLNKLIDALAMCVPEMNVSLLTKNIPKDLERTKIMCWLYEQLVSQKLIDYIKWNDYCGVLPDIAVLSMFPTIDKNLDNIFELLEEIDWSETCVDYSEIPYMIPWVEIINEELIGYGMRLVSLNDGDGSYLMCVYNHDNMLSQLHGALSSFSILMNFREPKSLQEAKKELLEGLYISVQM